MEGSELKQILGAMQQFGKRIGKKMDNKKFNLEKRLGSLDGRIGTTNGRLGPTNGQHGKTVGQLGPTSR